MAWPADAVQGQTITHTYFNSVLHAIASWGGTVSGNGNLLDNVVVAGRHGSTFLSRDSTVNGFITVGRVSAEATMAVAASAGQYASGAQAGDFVFRSEGTRVLLGVGAVETLTLTANGGVKITNLPTSSPGAGTKQLWVDTTDGNRVKFAV